MFFNDDITLAQANDALILLRVQAVPLLLLPDGLESYQENKQRIAELEERISQLEQNDAIDDLDFDF